MICTKDSKYQREGAFQACTKDDTCKRKVIQKYKGLPYYKRKNYEIPKRKAAM